MSGYHILHIIRSADPVGGGPVEGVRQLTRVHAQDGHQSEVVTLDAAGAGWLQDFSVPCYGVGVRSHGYGFSPHFLPWLRLHRARFDAVFVHGLWQYSSLGTWCALRRTTTPYFVFPHGMLDPWFKRTYPLKHAKKWLYWPWADYRVLRDARGVLFTGEEERALARHSFWLYRGIERVVGFGTTDPVRPTVLPANAFLGRFPEATGRRCLLFLGRVHPKKGPDLLLRALARLLAQRPTLRAALCLVLAGPNDHEYGREIRKLVQQLGLDANVIWTGMITGDLKWGAFGVAEAFVLPSHQENFGVAVAEATACGVPVLISRRVGVWREIVGEQAGYVGDDTVTGTEELLKRWLDTSSTEWATMRVNARRCFTRHFDIRGTADRLIGLVRQASGSGPIGSAAGRRIGRGAI